MISIFKNNFEKHSERNLSELSYFDGIKNGQWEDEVLNYRAGRTEKKTLTCITASGVFAERKREKLVEHSGLICLDIDAKDQICTIDIEDIKNDQYTYVVHNSVGGKGYAVFVKIDGARHLDAYLGLEHYYLVNFNIILDKSCKDTTRLRYVSFDSDLFMNQKAKVFKSYLKKEEKQKKNYSPIVVKSDFDEMINQAKDMNLFDDYQDYILLAFGLSNEFGENGRQYFHLLCQSSPKYDQKRADKDYSTSLKGEHTITIGTVYYKFREAGIKLISEKTQKIKTIAQLAENPSLVLKENNIEDSENLVEKFLKKDNSEKTSMDLVIELIKLSKIKFNEITRYYELNGDEMVDRVFAEFYTTVWQKIDEDFSKDKIFTLIQNRKFTQSYNPIRMWFDKNKHLKTNNEFEKLVKCFEIEHYVYTDTETLIVSDYLDVYLKKWLLGLIGSAFGTYSLMILVLNGEQGTKKTEFFRNLLPVDLRCFYSESNLDDGKDSEILMTKKWLIVDDEFGGKSKKDSTKLKRLSSQQTFSIRMPYGKVSEDLERLAVLGGTSNEDEVINDPTGNRRIIPINLIDFDFESYILIDKNKLFIELYNEWLKNKEGWFLTKSEIEYLNKSTEKNVEVMSEVELINKYFVSDNYSKMTNSDVKFQLEKLHPTLKTNTKRMGFALKKCGYQQYVKKIDGKTMRYYEIMFRE